MHLSKRACLSLVLFVLSGLFVFSFFHKAFNGDEAIIGEFAYWLDKTGYVKAEMFDGMGMGWEKRMYHYHKFFTLVGSWVIHAFGVSLSALRSISLLFFLLFLLFLNRYFRKRKDAFDQSDFLLCVIVLLLNSTFFDFAFLYRPETMIMSLGFISFYLLQKGLNEGKTALLFVSAALAGLCAFTHLNGLIFIFAGGATLLFERKILLAFGYGLVGGLLALLYFYDLRTEAEFQAFLHQFTNDPNLGQQHFHLYTPFLKILNEHMRFFRSPKEIGFSVLFLLSLIFYFRKIRTEHRLMLIYLLALIIGLAGISHGPTAYYAVVYFPYIAIIITIGIRQLTSSPPLIKKAFSVVLVIYVLSNGYYISRLLLNSVNAAKESEAISRSLPKKNVKVIAGEFFFFNQIQNYHICIPLTYEILCNRYRNRSFGAEDFFHFAQENGNEYVIFSKAFTSRPILEMVNFDQLQPQQKLFGYSVLKKDDKHVIFQKDTP
jgi:hypothetical protein